MRTLGMIRIATPPPPRDLWPRLRAGLLVAEERVALELPAFTWPWRLAAGTAVAVPLLLPDPFRFLTASGLF